MARPASKTIKPRPPIHGAMELVMEGNVFFEGRPQRLALGIEDGTIVEIKKVIKGVRTIDFGGRLVMPGALDVHVHFREPGLTHKEDFLTGTTAAACGGVTCVLDMPNTKPPTATAEDLRDKAALVAKKAAIDFGLFAGLTGRGRPERMAPLAVGYKLYMGSTTGDLLVDDYARLPEILHPLAAGEKPVAVHAEDEVLLRSIGIKARDPLSYNDARPPECESGAVKKFIAALGANRGHICHLSSRGALEQVAAAGGRVSCEVTPHHLLLDAREDNALGTFGKMNPPLRRREERAALWSAFARGEIGVLASDHAPHLEEEKDAPFAEAPAGIPGTETMVPLLLTFVKSGRLEIARLVDAACERPASVFGIGAGRIGKGMPAHLAVYDLHEVRQVRGKRLASKCSWTPFEGREAIFPKAVFLRGEPVVEDWEPVTTPGAGRFVTGRTPSGPG